MEHMTTHELISLADNNKIEPVMRDYGTIDGTVDFFFTIGGVKMTATSSPNIAGIYNIQPCFSGAQENGEKCLRLMRAGADAERVERLPECERDREIVDYLDRFDNKIDCGKGDQ